MDSAENVEYSQEICWVCEATHQTLRDLTLDQIEKLTLLTGIKNRDGQVVRRLCENCVLRLNDSYRFVQQCIDAENRLQICIDQQLVCEETDVHIDENSSEMMPNVEVYLQEFQDIEEFEGIDEYTGQETVKIPCTKCKRVFSSVTQLEEHEKMHLKTKKFSCTQCGMNFTAAFSLKRHIRNMHLNKKSLKPKNKVDDQEFPEIEEDKVEHFEDIEEATEQDTVKECTDTQLEDNVTGELEENVTEELEERVNGELEEHGKMHQKNKKFSCIQCGMNFTAAFSLKRHVRNIHLNKRRLKPKQKIDVQEFPKIEEDKVEHFEDIEEVTGQDTVNEEQGPCTETQLDERVTGEREKHVTRELEEPGKMHQKNKKFSCKQCGMNFTAAFSLKRHVRDIHLNKKRLKPKKKVAVQEFPEIEEDKVEHFEDIKKATGQDDTVKECTDTQLEEHEEMHQKTKKFSCTYCGMNFTASFSLKRHIHNIHLNEKRFKPKKKVEYCCAQCGMTFATSYSLKRHVHNIHLNLKRFMCEECGHSSTDVTQFKSHKLTHITEKNIPCEQCPRWFRTAEQLARHAVQHDPVEYRKMLKHECDVCHQMLSSAQALNVHKKRHTEPAFMCSDCGERFPTKISLKLHTGKHSNERPFECLICNRTFKTRKTLFDHKMTHTEHKPHECDICHRRFRTHSQMKTHWFLHTGLRPHVCQICKKDFNRPWALRFHMKTHFKESDDRGDEAS